MRHLTVLTGLSAFSLLGSVSALQSLSDYIKKVPDCALDAFRNAMEDAGCKVKGVDASTIDCLCDHTGRIAIAISRDVDDGCSADFANAIGFTCGTWLANTTPSDLAKATSILGDELSGKGGAGSPKATTTASDSDGTNAAETSVSEDAAVATGAPSLAGLAGGAVAVMVGLMI